MVVTIGHAGHVLPLEDFAPGENTAALFVALALSGSQSPNGWHWVVQGGNPGVVQLLGPHCEDVGRWCEHKKNFFADTPPMFLKHHVPSLR